MKRRGFVALVGGAVVAPLVVVAQPARRLPRVGFVLNSAVPATMEGAEPKETVMRGFVHGLRALGYEDGRNIAIERRTAEGRLERLEGLIRDLAQAPVDVIVVTGNTMALAAMKVTSTVPVIVAGMGTPVEHGIVRSLARPGGNVTGLVPTFGMEYALKRLELIRESLPNARRVAVFGIKEERTAAGVNELSDAAARLGFALVFIQAQLPSMDAGLAQLERERVDAVDVAPLAPLFVHIDKIVDVARRARIPDFHGFHQAVDSGALASYGHDAYDLFRRAAEFVVRILNGASPAEMPVEQIERQSLVLNLKTAKALGVTFPQAVLLRADRVIE
ncbi:MAG: ABC transporter substrate-binding protein [Betaproteobacteria bacterium]